MINCRKPGRRRVKGGGSVEKPKAINEAADGLKLFGVLFGAVGGGLALWGGDWWRALAILGAAALVWALGRAVLSGYQVAREVLALAVVAGAFWVLKAVRDPFTLAVDVIILWQIGRSALGLYQGDCADWFSEQRALRRR